MTAATIAPPANTHAHSLSARQPKILVVGGHSFESSLTDREAADRLTELVRANRITSDFAKSLADQHNRGRRLSDRQAAWAQRLVSEATAPQAPPATAPAGRSLKPILDHFTAAGRRLRRPTITIEKPIALCLKLAGARSRHAGQVLLTDGPKYGSTYFGRINADGAFVPSSQAGGDSRMPQILRLLDRIAANPSHVLGELGRESGACVFCRRALTDERSTHVGYGPVCAENWGLAWGESPAPADRLASLIVELGKSIEGFAEVFDLPSLSQSPADCLVAADWLEEHGREECELVREAAAKCGAGGKRRIRRVARGA